MMLTHSIWGIKNNVMKFWVKLLIYCHVILNELYIQDFEVEGDKYMGLHLGRAI